MTMLFDKLRALNPRAPLVACMIYSTDDMNFVYVIYMAYRHPACCCNRLELLKCSSDTCAKKHRMTERCNRD